MGKRRMWIRQEKIRNVKDRKERKKNYIGRGLDEEKDGGPQGGRFRRRKMGEGMA